VPSANNVHSGRIIYDRQPTDIHQVVLIVVRVRGKAGVSYQMEINYEGSGEWNEGKMLTFVNGAMGYCSRRFSYTQNPEIAVGNIGQFIGRFANTTLEL